MRYTYKKISGALCLLLATMVITRVIPDWFYYSLLAVIAIMIFFLLYHYSRY